MALRKKWTDVTSNMLLGRRSHFGIHPQSTGVCLGPRQQRIQPRQMAWEEVCDNGQVYDVLLQRLKAMPRNEVSTMQALSNSLSWLANHLADLTRI